MPSTVRPPSPGSGSGSGVEWGVERGVEFGEVARGQPEFAGAEEFGVLLRMLKWFYVEVVLHGRHGSDLLCLGELSLRTYRRRVADLMAALGADSRFQAGLRARELGLNR